jgi:endonuclease/exonuclease/phosphatase family metal-dependent hydrolase
MWKRFMPSNKAKEIAKLDEERRKERFNNICTIIDFILKYNNRLKIVCLQEVNASFLKVLKNKFITETHMLIATDDVVDNRVTIFDRRISVMSHETICYNGTVYGSNNKSILVCHCSIGSVLFDIANVHIGWNVPVCQMAGIAAIIEEKLINEKYVICGDFNKNNKQLDSFLEQFSCLNFDKGSDEMTGFNPSTELNEKIDHMLLSSTFGIDDIQSKILSKIAGITIMYDFESALKLFKKGESGSIWKVNGDTSDHKIIGIKFNIA